MEKKIPETSRTKMTILVTGAAGFIGFHLSKSLLRKNTRVIGIDNLNSYYDVNLKKKRLQQLKKNKNFFFIKLIFRKKNFLIILKQKKLIV